MWHSHLTPSLWEQCHLHTCEGPCASGGHGGSLKLPAVSGPIQPLIRSERVAVGASILSSPPSGLLHQGEAAVRSFPAPVFPDPAPRVPRVAVFSFLSASLLCGIISSVHKSHFIAGFSTDFSKSRLDFCVTYSHFWLTLEPTGSLSVLWEPETSVCLCPLARQPDSSHRF